MTPAEKANKLRYEIERAMVDADMFGHYDRAIRQCALIAVDEIIKILQDLGYDNEDYRIIYQLEVKQEIESL
jgi:hypothetical protein